ncbi:MAG: type II toxin-antitoxin system RelE/ParE family toxin [Lachnospiraceae bacterium]|nr:type II toxin-antitoxin system RelE/ParE family toxin [Lachnospiraceae bacterium]
MYEVKVTRQAQEQMAEIVDYITFELFAPDAAHNLLDKMENSIMALTEFPERNQLIDEEPWRTKGIRKIVVNNFLVYYWINNVEKKVHITAVIYSKREQLEQLRNTDH